ncbi:MAG: hypothetical protein IKW76_08895 [Clostridia bacterium]|nr:hypothetical protein [Clostridia bacterium]
MVYCFFGIESNVIIRENTVIIDNCTIGAYG